MARSLRISTPPHHENPSVDRWQLQVTNALNELPAFSITSSASGPEGVESANPGTLLLDVGSSTTKLWVKSSGVTSTGWTGVA